MEHQDLLETARKRFEEAWDYERQDREDAAEDIGILCGDETAHWSKTALEMRRNARPQRPVIVINKIAEKVDHIDSEHRAKKIEIQILPIDDKADPIIAEIMEGLIRHIEYASNAGEAYQTSFYNKLVTGKGGWRYNVVKCDDDPRLSEIVIERLPNSFMIWDDPFAQRRDRRDRRYLFLTETLTKDEFEAKFPGEKLEDFKSWDIPGNKIEVWTEGEKIRVCQYWWVETKTIDMLPVRTPDGKIILKEQRLVLPDEPVDPNHPEVIKSEQRTVKYCHLCFNRIIDAPKTWPGKYIPVVVEYGKELIIHGKKSYRGMIRNAISSQRLYNYWTTTITEFVAMAPKVPWLLTPAMIENHQDQWDTQHITNASYLLFNPDAELPGATPQRQMPPLISTAMTAELTRLEHEIHSTMAVYPAKLGDHGPETSGRAILARQAQTQTSAYIWEQTHEAALMLGGIILIDLIPKVYDTERIVRIIGKEGDVRFVPINTSPLAESLGRFRRSADAERYLVFNHALHTLVNDLTIGKYDIKVQIGPPPDPALMMQAQKVELEKLKLQMEAAKFQVDTALKELETKSTAILKLAQAEAQEMGRQLQEYRTIMESLLQQTAVAPQSQPQPRMMPKGNM